MTDVDGNGADLTQMCLNFSALYRIMPMNKTSQTVNLYNL